MIQFQKVDTSFHLPKNKRFYSTAFNCSLQLKNQGQMRKCLQLFKCPRGLVNYLAPPTYEDLKIAVIKGDLQKVELLIQNGVPLFGHGENILHFCITQKNIEILQKLCEKFPDAVDQRNDDGDSPFMMAILLKYRQAIDYLAKISNTNICDNNGNTAFMIAASNGDIETLRFLLVNNRECMYVKNFQGQNALHRACYFGQILTVSYLIKRTNLKLGMKDKKGNTSLHYACKGISFNVARYIVKKVHNWGETLMVKNKENKSPFDLMLQSINKIGDKNIRYNKEQLKIAITGEIIHDSGGDKQVLMGENQTDD